MGMNTKELADGQVAKRTIRDGGKGRRGFFSRTATTTADVIPGPTLCVTSVPTLNGIVDWLGRSDGEVT